MYGSPTFVTSPATVRIMAAAAKSDDKLKLGNNMAIQKLLSQIGDNFPEDEKVVLSAKLIKINRRQKEQVLYLICLPLASSFHYLTVYTKTVPPSGTYYDAHGQSVVQSETQRLEEMPTPSRFGKNRICHHIVYIHRIRDSCS